MAPRQRDRDDQPSLEALWAEPVEVRDEQLRQARSGPLEGASTRRVSGKRTSLTDSTNGPAPEDAPESINSGLAGLVVGFLQVDEPTLRCDAF